MLFRSSIGSGSAVAVQGDMGSLADVQRLVDETVKHFGKIDLLVPAAGIMPLMALDAMTEESYDKTFNTNVKGPLFLAQVCSLHPLQSCLSSILKKR